MKRLVPVIALALMATACGPSAPLDVGVKEIDTNVLIGPPQPTGPIRPPGGSGPVFGFPGIIEPPVIIGPPEPPEPEPCPAADPLSPIDLAAPSSIDEPPVEASYVFRNAGTYERGDASGALAATSIRQIDNVVQNEGASDFTFDVVIPGPLGARTTTTYHVYPDAPNAAEQPGIYIDSIVTEQPGADDLSFSPIPSLELFRFPAVAGTSWSSRGVDPFQHTAMSFDARILRKEIVDACGTKLEGWLVDLTNGSLSDAVSGTEITFAESFIVATQYGGIILQNQIDWRGTDRGTPTRITNTARITTEPKVPS